MAYPPVFVSSEYIGMFFRIFSEDRVERREKREEREGRGEKTRTM